MVKIAKAQKQHVKEEFFKREGGNSFVESPIL